MEANSTFPLSGVGIMFCYSDTHATFFFHSGSMPNYYLSDFRMASPVVLLWLYFLCYGRGLTTRIFNLKPLIVASPWAYHLYLLQMPVLRWYWLATRGYGFEDITNAPVKWWEVPILIFLSVVAGAVLQMSAVQFLMPYTSRAGVKTCSFVQNGLRKIFHRNRNKSKAQTEKELVIDLLTTLSGTSVDAKCLLADLNLHSLGASAFLSVVKASIPRAKNMRVVDLAKLETVGELIEALELKEDVDIEDTIATSL